MDIGKSISYELCTNIAISIQSECAECISFDPALEKVKNYNDRMVNIPVRTNLWVSLWRLIRRTN